MARTENGPSHQRIRDLLRRGRVRDAERACARLIAGQPPDLTTLTLYSRVLEAVGDFDAMLNAARQGAELRPGNTDAHLRLAHCLYRCGDVKGALDLLRHMEATGGSRPRLLRKVAARYAEAGQHADARRCLLKASEIQPENAEILLHLARASAALDMRRQAHRLLERTIAIDPDLHVAWYLRATTRTQAPEGRHVKSLSYMIDRLGPDAPGRVPLCFALAHELDNLGRYDEAFVCLQEAASLARSRQPPAPEPGRIAADAITAAFNAARLKDGPRGPGSERPVFVVGLPGSGVSRVARLLGAHSEVDNLGDTGILTNAVHHAVGRHGDAAEFARRSAALDMADLGNACLAAIAGFGRRAARQVDATGGNFLHLGLLRLALPRARVIHVVRHPLDSCMALYRNFGPDHGPGRRDLLETGREYVAYHRLMRHWRNVLPGAFLEVDTELLLASRKSQTLRLLEYLGLEWEGTCLDALETPDTGPALRQRYARQLGALRKLLETNGVPAG